METTTITRGIYEETAKETQGRKFTEVGDELEKKGEQLEVIASGINAKVKKEIPETRDAEEAVEGLSDETREEIQGVLETTPEEEAQAEVLQAAAKELKEGAKDLKDTSKEGVMENKKHEGDILGEAKLGEKGSQSGDAAKLVGKTTLIDKEKAKGLVAHETEHTGQVAQTVQQVSLDGQQVEQKPVSNDLNKGEADGVVNATELVEAGAMIEQKRSAPKSVSSLADSYRRTLTKVLRALPDENKVVELARKEDGLEQFGKEARARKGVKEVPAGMAA